MKVHRKEKLKVKDRDLSEEEVKESRKEKKDLGGFLRISSLEEVIDTKTPKAPKK